jgi:hypothetical protein
MSHLEKPSDCLFFSSVIYHEDYFSIDKIKSILKSKMGDVEVFHPGFNPSLKYYAKEMGEELKLHRLIFFNFKNLHRDQFVPLKVWADEIERQNSHNQKRTINIDIGLLSKEQMLLATGKPYSHRIYLDKGVYADLTYTFANESYQSLVWSYPDYAHQEKIMFFNWLRQGLF